MVQEYVKDTDSAQDMGAAQEIQEIEGELAAISDGFENIPAQEIVEWAVERYGHSLALACSFQDCVIIDLANRVDPDMEVIFLDTGYHFAETLAYVEQVKARYGLNLTVTVPGDDAAGWPCGSARCCEFRKVGPLQRVLEGKAAWMTALKRCDSPTRSSIPIVSWDPARSMVKVNPLATWSDEDADSYIAFHRLPIHPLMEKGYLSIGCAPTTRPIEPGEHSRAGRWAGTGKTECGLHT
ncbi:MAG: phosphoadenylyl-sulfate reductase [Acidimicrobiales bacterium]